MNGRDITRRDFLDGVALGIGGAMALPDAAGWLEGATYPPALTGLRGSHAGSFEALHQLRDGTLLQTLGQPTSSTERYDLVVVGAGISGLTAAHRFRKERPAARILILDNHDDFGGHAKRNEFQHEGRTYYRSGDLWVGTFGSGLGRFSYATEKFRTYRARPNDPAALSNDMVPSIAVDAAGTLWVGTYLDGLCRFDPATERFKTFRHQPGNANSLVSNDVYALTADQRGNLWVGTYGGGLSCFNPGTGPVPPRGCVRCPVRCRSG